MLQEHDILNALTACFDTGNPFGKPLTVVELGSVDRILLTLDPDAPGAGIAGVPARQRLSLTLTPASADDDARAQLSAQIRNALGGIEGLSHVSLALSDEPWTVDRMSPEARRKAGIGMFAILNNKLAR
jgi:metal-sulfur cluster biosynthetic enzyme